MASRILLLLTVASIMAPLQTRAEMPHQFSGTDVRSGVTVKLGDYRGKIVLVDFWASWCPPCLDSLPAWERLRQAFGPARFEVIAINVDEDLADGLEFLETVSISYPVLSDPEGTIGKPWGVRSLPRFFLLNKNGEVEKSYHRFRPGGEEELYKEIVKLLGQ